MCQSAGSGDKRGCINHGGFDICSFGPSWEIGYVGDRAPVGDGVPVVV